MNAVKGVASFVVKESINAFKAAKKGTIESHIKERAYDASIALLKAIDKVAVNIKTICKRLETQPEKEIPELFIAILGFYFGSGGLDGDGGIPDLDIKMGIGAHRSIWFHSILPGSIIETAVFSLVVLVNLVYKNLPAGHDELWDRFVAKYKRLSVAFASGICAGLAYHLMVDATWHAGKAYSDLPLSASMEAHQIIMGINSKAEGIDINKRKVIKFLNDNSKK